MTGYITSALTPEERAMVPDEGYYPLLWDEIPIAIREGARVYGYVEDEKTFVRLVGEYSLSDLAGRISFAWSDSRAWVDALIAKRLEASKA